MGYTAVSATKKGTSRQRSMIVMLPMDNLIQKNRRCRNQHSMAFQIPLASTNAAAYLHSFFPQTIIRDWNDHPDSLITSAEMSDDCVSKFSSLLRDRD